MRVLSIIAVLIVAGCGTVDPVTLRHPETGKTVVCHGGGGLTANAAARRVVTQRGCIEDFRSQGYRRVP